MEGHRDRRLLDVRPALEQLGETDVHPLEVDDVDVLPVALPGGVPLRGDLEASLVPSTVRVGLALGLGLGLGLWLGLGLGGGEGWG